MPELLLSNFLSTFLGYLGRSRGWEEKRSSTSFFILSYPRKKSFSCVRLFATLWTIAHKAPPSMGFSRQEHWSGLPFPSPGNLSNPGMKPGSPALQVGSLPSEPPIKTLTAESKGIDMAVKREFDFISLTFQKIERETTIGNLT